ncbi:hypothetical protein BDC45DRAFT_512191 [Circinella umbellata]|nr:hypothetical protein BDC45DRAFT_512191 [Circinella umbellata]
MVFPSSITPSPNDGCKALYIGNLDARVTDSILREIFSVTGHVKSVKVIPDKNMSHGGCNYGFIEFIDHRTAEQALLTMSGRRIFSNEIKVNWAAQGSTQKDDTSKDYHIFIGDLCPEVSDDVLAKAFGVFNSMSDARVMWDMNTGKSRGFGFVAFKNKAHAEQAIATMNGERLRSRAIRVNWANQKNTNNHHQTTTNTNTNTTTTSTANTTNIPTPTTTPAVPAAAVPMQYVMPFEQVLTQTSAYNTTVYVGNLSQKITQNDLIPLFQRYGGIMDIRLQPERGFAFIKMDMHETAALAIYSLQGATVNNRIIKLSWGRDRSASQDSNHSSNTSFYNYYQQPPLPTSHQQQQTNLIHHHYPQHHQAQHPAYYQQYLH